MRDTFKELPTGEIIFEGKTYPGATMSHKRITFSFEKWMKHWEKRVQEIKTLKLTYGQIKFIYGDFVHDILSYGFSKQMVTKHQEINQLSTELKIAFEQAYSNYRDSRKGLWSFITGLFVNKLIDKIEILKLPLEKL